MSARHTHGQPWAVWAARTELEHAVDVDSIVLVGVGDSGAADEADLLGGIPLELDRVARHEAVLDQDAEGLEEGDAARAVVVGAGGAAVGRVLRVDAVLVRADDDERQARLRAGKVGDQRALVKVGVHKLLDGNVGAVAGHVADHVVEPVGRGGARFALEMRRTSAHRRVSADRCTGPARRERPASPAPTEPARVRARTA